MRDDAHEAVASFNLAARGRKLIAAGAVVLAYSVSWQVLCYRAARIEHATCKVIKRPYDASHCAVAHEAHGEIEQLPFRPCNKLDLPPGATMTEPFGCFYYVSFPGQIFFEPREHRPFSPGAAAAAGGALLLLGAGWRLHSSAKARPRRRQQTERPTGARLEVPISTGHWLRWLFAGPFLMLGLLLAAVTALLLVETGGELGSGSFALLMFSHVVPLGGALGVGHRSALVLDEGEGTLEHWWGLWGRHFARRWALADVRRVEMVTERGARSASHYLVVWMSDDGPALKLGVGTADETAAAVGQVERFLRDVRQRRAPA